MLYHRVIFGALIAASASVTTAVPVRDSGDALDARMAKLEEKVKKLAPTFEYGIKEQGQVGEMSTTWETCSKGSPNAPAGFDSGKYCTGGSQEEWKCDFPNTKSEDDIEESCLSYCATALFCSIDIGQHDKETRCCAKANSCPNAAMPTDERLYKVVRSNKDKGVSKRESDVKEKWFNIWNNYGFKKLMRDAGNLDCSHLSGCRPFPSYPPPSPAPAPPPSPPAFC